MNEFHSSGAVVPKLVQIRLCPVTLGGCVTGHVLVFWKQGSSHILLYPNCNFKRVNSACSLCSVVKLQDFLNCALVLFTFKISKIYGWRLRWYMY